MSRKDRVTVQYDASPDGTTVADWRDLWANIPANVDTVAGGERYFGRQMDAETKYAVDILFRPGLDQRYRIVVLSGPHSGKTLSIIAISVEDRRGAAKPPAYIVQCGD